MSSRVLFGVAGLGLLFAQWSCESTTDPDVFVAGEAQFPLDSWLVTQDFGVWNSNWDGYHLAEDVDARGGDPVYTIADGVVAGIFTGVQGYEAVMLIEHRFDELSVVSLYGHVSTRRGFEVSEGEAVSKGDLIAYIADDDEDGGSWGPHLHFGIRTGRYSLAERICGYWLYVGYTRVCPGITHEEHRALWLDPTDFIVSHGGRIPVIFGVGTPLVETY
ncbi:MAG: M23 family metallopeptidase [Gemmatimonadota bacterium]|nr:MAG: M23 family metallopeptidase [Gemmatimonadota bacterium]